MLSKSKLQSILPSVLRMGLDDLLIGKEVLGSDLSAHSTITTAKLPMSLYRFFGQANNKVAVIRENKDVNANKLAGLQLLREREVRSPFHGRYLYASEGTLVAPLHESDLLGYLIELQDEEYRLSTEEIRNLFGQLVLAVEALHDKNIVHNDLKPENVLITELIIEICGDVPQLSLIDWDEISLVNDNGFIDDESKLVVKGRSHGWMSIEMEKYLLASSITKSLLEYGADSDYVQCYLQQYMGIDKPILPNSKSNDCFALGCVLYCLFTGDNHLPIGIKDSLYGKNRTIGAEGIKRYERCLHDYRKCLTDNFQVINDGIASDPINAKEATWRLWLNKLVLELIADEPSRLTVKQIKEHGFFGNNPDQCAQFFADLQEGYEKKSSLQKIRDDLRECNSSDEREKLIVELQQAHKQDHQAQTQFQVNGYHHDGSLQADNTFYLLPEAIQDLYVDVEDIGTLSSYLLKNENARVIGCDEQDCLARRKIEQACLVRKIEQATKDIDSLSTTNKYENYKSWMDLLSIELKDLFYDYSKEHNGKHSQVLTDPENLVPNIRVKMQ